MTTTPEIGPRPRSLPIAPQAEPSRRRLPLAPEARAVDRQWRPIYAVWEITLRCDLACRHCGSRAGRSRPDELSTDEALDLVRQMAELGTKEVTVIGGEAYLRDDWLEIVRAIRSRGMICTMTTGGRGITAELARGAKEAGLQSVSVSVDGLEDTHDALRGVKGSYQSAFEALRLLRAAGIPVSANTQIGRVSLHEIPALFELLIAAGIHSWQVQLTVAMGRAADEPQLLLEPYQVLEVMPMLARLKKRADEAKVRIWPGNNIGYFGPYESVLRGTLPRGHMHSCGAGRSTLGIEANGDIKGCPSLPTADYVGGNVREHTLEEIWERAAPLRFTRDRTVEDLWGYCRTCYYNDVCRAGCSWTSHVLFGRPGNNPFCHHRALELLRDNKRERLERSHAAEGKPFDYGRFEVVVEDWPAEERARMAFEAVHATDPRALAGEPFALAYHRRLSHWVRQLNADASEPLRLAACCQHLRRWAIPRSDFPAGLSGYKRWRSTLARAHGEEAAAILTAAGYDGATIARVRDLLAKKGLKLDPEVQLLEDAICLVFLELELESFADKHPRDKLIDILRKTWRKMSPRGREAALALPLAAPLRALVEAALAE